MNNAEAIITLGSQYWGISEELLKAKTRKREVVIARQSIMSALKEFTDYSLKSIGFMFGNRDHSTVIHALTAVNDMIDTDIHYAKRLVKFKEKVIKDLDIVIDNGITSEEIKSEVNQELSHWIVDKKEDNNDKMMDDLKNIFKEEHERSN